MSERVAVFALSLALTVMVGGLVGYALRAVIAVADVTAHLGNLPPP